MRTLVGPVAVVLILASTTGRFAVGAERNSCDAPYDFVSFRFELKEATKSPNGDFIGEFEIENTRFGQEIVLEGRLNGNVLSIGHRQIEPQFMDLNGSWVSFNQMPGDFIAPPNTVGVSPGSKTLFVTRLPSDNDLVLGGRKFRLLLRLSRPDICIASTPFVAIQQRGPVQDFKTEERSNKAFQRTLEDSRR